MRSLGVCNGVTNSNESLVSALDRACRNDDILKKVRQKAEKLLIEFASTKKVSYKSLRVIHIATDTADIQPPLLRMINSAPRLPGQTATRHGRCMSENASCVRRLIRMIMGLRPKPKKGSKSSSKSVLFKEIPSYLKGVLDKFPRERMYVTRGEMKENDLLISLSPTRQLLLLALCKVARTIGHSKESSPLSRLLTNHRDLILAQLREVTSSTREYKCCQRTLYTLIKRVNLKIEEKELKGVKVEDWPQPLRDEYYACIQLARGKTPPSQSLLDISRNYKFPIGAGEGTIRLVTYGIGQLIGFIPRNETLGVADLLRLEPTEVPTEEGVKVEGRNSRVDWVREIELARQSRSKRVGYDSESFRQFIYAIKFIGARNGYAYLMEAFNVAYRVNLDKETKQENKDIKKRGITRDWIDEELRRLDVEFERIVKRGCLNGTPAGKK